MNLVGQKIYRHQNLGNKKYVPATVGNKSYPKTKRRGSLALTDGNINNYSNNADMTYEPMGLKNIDTQKQSNGLVKK